MGCQNRGATLPSERLPGGPKTWPVTPGLGWATLRLSGPSQSEGDELASDLTHPLSLSEPEYCAGGQSVTRLRCNLSDADED